MPKDNSLPVPATREDLNGTFVETAFTNDQVALAMSEDARLGLLDVGCAFLGEDPKTDDAG